MRIILSNREYERWRYFAQQWNKRSQLPALRAVTYVSDGTTVSVRCTNLVYWIQKPVFARANGKGVCVVPTVHTVSEPTVELHQTKQALTLNGRAIDTSEYEPFALPIPLDKLVPRIRCYRTDLIHALQFALPAMKTDTNDNRMHGVRIVGTKTSLLVEATDSFRIHQKYVASTPKGGCPLKPPSLRLGAAGFRRLGSIHPQGWVPVETSEHADGQIPIILQQ